MKQYCFLLSLLLVTHNNFSGEIFSTLKGVWSAGKEMMKQISPDPYEGNNDEESVRAQQIANLSKKLGRFVLDGSKDKIFDHLKENNDCAVVGTLMLSKYMIDLKYLTDTSKNEIQIYPHLFVPFPCTRSSTYTTNLRQESHRYFSFYCNLSSQLKQRKLNDFKPIFIPNSFTLLGKNIGLLLYFYPEKGDEPGIKIDDFTPEMYRKVLSLLIVASMQEYQFFKNTFSTFKNRFSTYV